MTLEPLGVDDSKGDKKKPSVGQFLSSEANLIVCAMTGEHRRRLHGLLGADLKKTTDEAPGAAEKSQNGRRQAVAMAYAPDSWWRNRSTFVQGREQIIEFLRQEWARELNYRSVGL